MAKINEKALAKVNREENFSFADRTTFGCGGRAKCAFYPSDFREMRAVYDALSSAGERIFVLGNGSDVLASDRGFEGYVICTKNFRGIFRTGANTLFCRAGTQVSALMEYCKISGFSGLEYLVNIPATIGGITYMNGGAFSHSISDNVTTVKFYDGKIRSFMQKNCKFGYKYSTMRDINGIISGVELKFTQSTSQIVAEKICEYKSARSAQPAGRSCGCVFKNPDGLFAGKLIEEAGLKGVKIGEAYVSPNHANFIINGGNSAADVRRLIELIKRKVYEKFSVALEEEVVYIGEFDETYR